MTTRGRFRSRGFKQSFPRTLVTRARQLRREATPAGVLLWERLRNYQAGGVEFRRSQPLGRISECLREEPAVPIADFFCAHVKLIVEEDGGVHGKRGDVDAVREDLLERGGLQVIRFTNERVMRDLDEVVAEITQPARQRMDVHYAAEHEP